jgi:sugar transferase EpsL
MDGRFIKRILDFSAALVGLVFLSPVLIIISILILMKMGRPVFYTQKRPGLKNKSFLMFKFRTLTNEKDCSGNLLPENIRLKPLGAFLRAASLDELPELINVLKGEMSLVGPRPLRMYYLPLYNDFQKRRHKVRPGITGWAQVNGRNALSWEEKFELDVWYVENQSLILDLKIIFLTFFKVLKRENTTAADGGFTAPFRGTGSKMISFEEVQRLKQKLG